MATTLTPPPDATSGPCAELALPPNCTVGDPVGTVLGSRVWLPGAVSRGFKVFPSKYPKRCIFFDAERGSLSVDSPHDLRGRTRRYLTKREG